MQNNIDERPATACSGTASFPECVDAVLDLANELGGKVTELLVSDVEPGVVDMHTTISVWRPSPVEHIVVYFRT